MTHISRYGFVITIMATKQENPQKDSWWINELESLGVSVKVRNELNDTQETSNLAENLKQIFYQSYKDAYNEWRWYEMANLTETTTSPQILQNAIASAMKLVVNKIFFFIWRTDFSKFVERVICRRQNEHLNVFINIPNSFIKFYTINRRHSNI
jgi:hypothetical protein